MGKTIKALSAIAAVAGLSLPVAAPCAEESAATIDPAAIEAQRLVIGDIILDKRDVFDLSNPKENKWMFRLANKWHILTKDRIITKQLLLEPGGVYSKRLADESERILRANTYFYDVAITPENPRDGKVDLRVMTKDVWTLNPGFSISRKGGENKTVIDIEELNLLGRGQLIRLARSDNVDRVSKSIEFEDKHLGSTWVSANLLYADNSDGDSRRLSLVRPFYALDTRWSGGLDISLTDQRGVLYDLGEPAAEYQRDRRSYSAWGGWSRGLQNGWVRRFTVGVAFDASRFTPVVDGLLEPAIPADRDLAYPFFGIEILEDSFEKTSNHDQIKKTEDFLTGTRITASIGWSNSTFGADRDAWLYSASASRLFGALDATALALSATAGGRIESGDTRNARFSLKARYSHRFSERHSFFAGLSGTLGHDLDLDAPVEIGGDTGLRGYPLRYQSGDSSLLLSAEHRYFWDWYPLRLFRVGGAVFADIGRTWGSHPLGGAELGWLKDIGFGLRFAPTRTGSKKIVHLDIAFPLDGDATIDDVQILLESKKSF